LFNNTTGNYNVGLGAYNLEANVSGSCNVAIGYCALNKSTSANVNVAVGYLSLACNTTGTLNVAVGHKALFTNTTGEKNVAIGSNAMDGNTTGRMNNAIGSGALQQNTGGSFNIAMGEQPLYFNSTGNDNVALGQNALYKNTTGARNIAIGNQSLFCNTTGHDNIGIGKNALRLNTEGRYNIGAGNQALCANTTGKYNVAIGFESAQKNTTAEYNVAFGFRAAQNNTTGSVNVAIGSEALKTTTTGVSNVAIGFDTMKLFLGPSSNVALGRAALCLGTGGQNNVAIGSYAMSGTALCNSHENVAIGYNTGKDMCGGDRNVLVGSAAGCKVGHGCFNTMLGHAAGLTSANVYGSVIIGYNTGRCNCGSNAILIGSCAGCGVSGSNSGSSVFIGGCSGCSITSGANNVYVGANSGKSTTTGSNNTVFGNNAFLNNTTGCSNIAIGALALDANTTGVDNVAIGTCSLTANTTGIDNTSVGHRASFSNSGGRRNTTLGRDAGFTITTGQNNVILGYDSQASSATTNNEITLGNSSIACFRIPGLNFGIGNAGDVTLANDKKVIFGDAGEHIAGDGSQLQITSSADINIMPGSGHRIGIGTNNATCQVHIANSAANKPFIRLETSDGGNKRLDLSIQSSNGVIEARQSAQCLIFDATTAVISKVNGTERMRIFSGGNVSFGTTQDQAKVQITTASSGVSVNANADELFVEGSGNSGITIGSGTSGAGQLAFGDSGDNDKGAIAYLHDVDVMRFSVNGPEKMRITSGGDLLIGKTSNGIGTAGFEVTSGGDFYATKSGSTIAQFNRLTNDGDVVRIKKDGTTKHVFTTTALGINQSSPSATLDVVGNAEINGTIYNNGKLNIRKDGASEREHLVLTNETNGTNASPTFTDLHFNGYSGKDRGRISVGDRSNNKVGGIMKIQTAGSESTDGSGLQTRIFLDNDGDIFFYEDTGTTAKVKWDAINERFGIGTTSPSSTLTVSGGSNSTVATFNNDVSATTTISDILLLQNNTTGTAGVGTGLSIAFNGERNDGNVQRFGNIGFQASLNSGTSLNTDFFIKRYLGTEVFRISHGGRITRDTTSTASGHGNFVGEVGASYRALAFEHTNGGGIVGNVKTASSSVQYLSASDYRLKENIDYNFDATTRLKQLKPARFNFKSDTNTTVDGFLAHEVSSVVPEAISGEKDAVNEDGTPDYQSIDQSKLVPLLVKTIQELEARIKALEDV